MKINTTFEVRVQPNLAPAESTELDNDLLREANERNIGIIRLFNWAPGGISIGSRQNLRDINVDAARADGRPIERRITGGGALLIGPQDFVMTVAIGKNVFPRVLRGIRIYCKINSVLVNALGHMGITAEKADETITGETKPAACFSNIERGELLNEWGQKIHGGSFSGTTKNGYYQQGYVALSDSYQRLRKYLAKDDNPVVTESGFATRHVRFNDLADKFEELLYGEYPEWQPY